MAGEADEGEGADMIRVHFDGACWPNPKGPCGYGYLISDLSRDPGKRTLKKGWGYLGKGEGMSNNVAEFAGLYHALIWLVDNNLSKERIVCKGDSKLVIKMMKGKWHPRGGAYTDLYLKVRMMKWKFPNIVFKWIPRENNETADRLSKRGKEGGNSK